MDAQVESSRSWLRPLLPQQLEGGQNGGGVVQARAVLAQPQVV
jgi:hypothetical protein